MITDNAECLKSYSSNICSAIMEDFAFCRNNGGAFKICGTKASMSAKIMETLTPVFNEKLKVIASADSITSTAISNSSSCAQRYAGFDMDDSSLTSFCRTLGTVTEDCVSNLNSTLSSWCKMSATFISDSFLSVYNGIKTSASEWNTEVADCTNLNSAQDNSKGIGGKILLITAGAVSVAAAGYSAFKGMKYLLKKCGSEKTETQTRVITENDKKTESDNAVRETISISEIRGREGSRSTKKSGAKYTGLQVKEMSAVL